MKKLLILGASSDIARSAAFTFANAGWKLFLAGRDVSELEAIAQDLKVKTGCQTFCSRFDATQPGDADTLWESMPEPPDAVLCAVGFLGDQIAARHDRELANLIIQTNFTGLLPVLSKAADVFEQRGQGIIIAISSVAGDRGRASNYTYGAAKAGLDAFLSGLRNRLHHKNVRVITVKPGFVRTRMTEEMTLPSFLTASPEEVARDIFSVLKRNRDVIYSRWFWRWIMLAIRLLPEGLFKRMRI